MDGLAWILLATAALIGFLFYRQGSLHADASLKFERKLREREQQLRVSEARLEEFLGALRESPNGVILLDENARIEWCNETAASHFGLDTVRDLGQYVGNLIRDPAFATYMTSWNYSRDVVMTASSRGPSPIRVSVQLHAYAGNRRLMLSRDITVMEQAEAMRREFVANASHEIRTPLTVLSGFVETMQSLDLPAEDRKRYLGLMSQQAQRMQTLVGDLLTLSRLEGSPPPGEGEWTPVHVFAAQCDQEARAASQNAVKAPRITIDRPVSAQLGGAPSELQSAMSNLLSNAIRYTPAGGDVHVQWRMTDDGRLEFAVKDSGPGIAPEHIPRLTERFYRVDRSRSRETGGTGLGLAIVKHVLQRHGAELKIESVQGVGSTFAIVFPASRVRASPTPDGTNAPRATESLAG